MPKTKPFKTLRAKRAKKLADQLVRDQKPIRTYKKREPGEVKESNHVTRDSLIARHQYCITVEDILREKARALRLGLRYDLKDEDIKGVCNHPNDGVCGADFTDAQIKEVNERLKGKTEERDETEDLENPIKKSTRTRAGQAEPKVKRQKVEKPPARYFCLKCDGWHEEGAKLYEQHIKNKRGRGRPKKNG